MVEVNVSKELLNELQLATQKVLAQYKLAGSDLSKSVEWVYRNDVFVLLANDYFQSVAFGRRPRARLVPVEDLIKWMKKKGISPRGGNYNSSAYAIQQAIFRNGIKPRKYINPVEEVTTEIISEDMAENLSEQIATEIAQDLTITI